MAALSLTVLLLTLFAVSSLAEAATTSGLAWTVGTSLINSLKTAWLDTLVPNVKNILIQKELVSSPIKGVTVNMTDVTLASLELESKNLDIVVQKNSAVTGGTSLGVSASQLKMNLTFDVSVEIGKFAPETGSGYMYFDEGGLMSLGIAPTELGPGQYGLNYTEFGFVPNDYKVHTTNTAITVLLGLAKPIVEKLVASTLETQVVGIFNLINMLFVDVLPDIKISDNMAIDLGLDQMITMTAGTSPSDGFISGSHNGDFMSLPDKKVPSEVPVPNYIMPDFEATEDNIQVFADQYMINTALSLLNSQGITTYVDETMVKALGSAIPLELTTNGIALLFPDVTARSKPNCGVSLGLDILDPFPLIGMVAGNNVVNLNANLKVYSGTVEGNTIGDPAECLASKKNPCQLMSSMDLALELGLAIEAGVKDDDTSVEVAINSMQVYQLTASKNPVKGDKTNWADTQVFLNELLISLAPGLNSKIAGIVSSVGQLIAPVAKTCGISLNDLTVDAAYGYASILAEPVFKAPQNIEMCFATLKLIKNMIVGGDLDILLE